LWEKTAPLMVCCLSLVFWLYLELYLVEISYVVGFIWCWGHGIYVEMFWFRCDFMLEIIFMH